MKSVRCCFGLVLAGMAAILAPGFCSCSGGQGFPDGGAQVSVVAPMLICENVASVVVTVTGPGITPAIVADLVGADCQWDGTIDPIPAGGSRVFTARAYDAGDVLKYEGQATGVTITGGAVAQVTILLQQTDPVDPFDNTAPFIDAIVASASEVVPGGSIDIEVQAHDVNADDTLSYLWTATGGTFSTPALAATAWTAPASEGVQYLTIKVTDSHGAAVDVRVGIVVQWEPGSATIEAEFNDWPSVSGIVPSKGLVGAGETVDLDLSASDPNLDPLTYAWADEGGECAGSFDDSAIEDPVWTAPAVLPASGECTLSVMVSDGRGGSCSGLLTLYLGIPPGL